MIGHDFGSPTAAWSAVTRPDVFLAIALMSAPFHGTTTLPFDTADDSATAPGPADPSFLEDLGRGSPHPAPPRKHYQAYYRTREANENM